MEIEVKAFEITNTIVSDWYSQLDFELIGGIGIVAHKGDLMIAAGFVIPTYSSFCFWEFVKTNPDVSMYLRAKAVKKLTQTAIQWAKDHGYKVLQGMVPLENKSLIKEYKRQGGVVYDKPHCVIARRL